MIRVILGFQHISLHSHFFCLIDMQLVSVSSFFLRFFLPRQDSQAQVEVVKNRDRKARACMAL